ncbi:MAG: cation diffusion facilitator family transporter [Chromatocurvus sp.]
MSEKSIDPEHAARLMRLATSASVAVAVTLILAKALAYAQTGSMSILASLIDSVMDSGASVLNLFAVRYALAPADRAHRFGHGKAESISALAQSILIIGSGLYLLFEAVQRLREPPEIPTLEVGIAVMLFTIVATLALLTLQQYVIRRTDSAAIRADALHYRTDLLTNSAVILALLLSQWGWAGMDPLFACGIAVYILFMAKGIMSDAFNELLDRELPETRRQLIRDTANRHPEVRGIHDLRTRSSGRIDFIELHLELDGDMPLRLAHHIADDVTAAIKSAIPTADVVIHQDPAGLSENRLEEKLAH